MRKRVCARYESAKERMSMPSEGKFPELGQHKASSSRASNRPASKPQVTPSKLQQDGASKKAAPARSGGLQQSMPQSGEKAKAGAPMRLRARRAMTSMLKNLFDMAVLIIITRGRI